MRREGASAPVAGARRGCGDHTGGAEELGEEEGMGLARALAVDCRGRCRLVAVLARTRAHEDGGDGVYRAGRGVVRTKEGERE